MHNQAIKHPDPCGWCGELHLSVRQDRRGARHRRFVRTRDNDWVAPVEHHNYATRINWGCRCTRCKEADRRYSAGYRARGVKPARVTVVTSA